MDLALSPVASHIIKRTQEGGGGASKGDGEGVPREEGGPQNSVGSQKPSEEHTRRRRERATLSTVDGGSNKMAALGDVDQNRLVDWRMKTRLWKRDEEKRGWGQYVWAALRGRRDANDSKDKRR